MKLHILVGKLASMIIALWLVACGGAQQKSTQQIQEMAEIRVVADPNSGEIDAYDVESLFMRGVSQLKNKQYFDAVDSFDRVVREFPDSSYITAALYNAGLALQRAKKWNAAEVRYLALVTRFETHDDALDARFQLGEIYYEIKSWQKLFDLSNALLAKHSLSSVDRMESLTRRAQALWGLDNFDDASAQARQALSFGRTHEDGDASHRRFLMAAANFTLAESFRARSEGMKIPDASVEEQKDVIETRARQVLEAQREYFNTISHQDPRWSAKAGYQIGLLYDVFWSAITNAPVPPPLNPLKEKAMALYREEYRLEIRELVFPLIRHAIRYWEMTLIMIEEQGADESLRSKIQIDLDRLRLRLKQEEAAQQGRKKPK